MRRRAAVQDMAESTEQVVVRLEGANVDLGKQILAESGLPIISANGLADAGQKVIAAAKGAK